MVVVKVGGPVYRIGVGGGAASSIQVKIENQSFLNPSNCFFVKLKNMVGKYRFSMIFDTTYI